MPPPPPLCIVRHGETDWNAENRLQGQQDIPLNGRGRSQAESVGRLLIRARPDIVDFDFVASPLVRARETMDLMRAAMKLPPGGYTFDDQLKELTFGSWEKLTWAQVRARDPGGAAAREANKWAFVPPDGESYEMLSQRIARWLAGIERPTLAVTHGGVARVLLGLICGLSHADVTMYDIVQGRALLFENGRADWI